MGFPLLLNLSLCVGPQDDRVVGAAIDNLDKARDEVSSVLQLYQPLGAVNRLPNQGSPPQEISVLVNAAEQHPVADAAKQIGSILESNQRCSIVVVGRIAE